MQISRNDIQTMITRAIGRILFRPSDTFESNGALAGNVRIAPGGNLLSTADGLSTAVGSILETGALVAFGDSSVKAEHIICEGQEVSRGTFSDLFAVIGTTYGVGDGSTTFNVPDLRGLAAVGVL